LLGEERVPLLERRELLERERIDASELGELALRLREPTLLDASIEGDRRVIRSLALMPRIPRNQLVGAIFRNQNIFVERQLGGDAFEQAAQVELLLVDLQLETVHALREPGETFTKRALLRTQRRELLVLRR